MKNDYRRQYVEKYLKRKIKLTSELYRFFGLHVAIKVTITPIIIGLL